MKNISKALLIALFIAISIIFTTSVFAQDPPPPPGGGHGGGGAQPPGGGAPIGESIIFLASLGVAYGGKKFYDFKKKPEE